MNEKFPHLPQQSSPTESSPLDHQGYDESPSEIYKRYLETLEIQEGDLVGKEILDVGSGSSGFAAGIKEKKIDAHVISVDDSSGHREEPPFSREGYVVATAQQLPFADNTFDMVVSVHAMPHVVALSSIKRGRATGELLDGYPVRTVRPEDKEKYESMMADSIAQAVRECIRVTKEGGEIRFGGIPMEKSKSDFDEEGLPTYPYVIKNTGAMKGLLEGSQGTARLLKYPESKEEDLFVLRKLTEAERPWTPDATLPGTAIKLEMIDIHPQLQGAAKQFTEMAAEIHQAATGESMQPNEVFGRMLKTEGVIDEEGGARFPLGDDPEDPGYFRIPAGYWRKPQ